jgi:hypothetical protein
MTEKAISRRNATSGGVLSLRGYNRPEEEVKFFGNRFHAGLRTAART